MPDQPKKRSRADDAALLEEIRTNFTYDMEGWHDIREEGMTDMRYATIGPWEEDEITEREQAKRPCVVEDQLTQYINQVVNDARQNPSAIRPIPEGDGANDKSALFLADGIRHIEHKSVAKVAYITGLEGSCTRSYGAWRLRTDYVSDKSFDQEIRIERIPDPDTVLYDWDAKELNFSDADHCFVLDYPSREKFKRDWPNAEIVDFQPEHVKAAPQWVKEKHVQVAEYWKVVRSFETLTIGKKSRKVEVRKIVQYITNGIEILEENAWAGKYIPIILCIGKEEYVDEGSGSRRTLLSLVRKARDPYKKLCFLSSQELEEAKLSPLALWEGYEGQFDTSTDWKNANKVPTAYVEFKAQVEAAGGAVLPLPRVRQFVPNFQAYQVAKEACIRAIQAAMGISPLPTAAQRNNEKSGVALETINSERAVGSFHIIDNWLHAIEYTGNQITDLWPHIYDGSDRVIGLSGADDTHRLTLINPSQQSNLPGETGKPEVYPTPMEDLGQHACTISTGPSRESQRDAENRFVDVVVKELPNWGPALPPGSVSKILALSIKMKDMGPEGDKIAELLDPPDQGQPNPAQLQQQVQGLQQQLNEAAVLTNQLQQERAGKVLETQSREKIETAKIASEEKKFGIEMETKLAVAEITTKAQSEVERSKLFAELQIELHQAGHDIAAQLVAQKHQALMAQQAQVAQRAQLEAQPQPEAQPAAQ